jgi:hypothetical protein
MAIGRISGPLLQQNLFRDNVPLAFYNTSSQTENPVLYLDVTDGFVGMQTSSPQYTLDVAGTINAQNLRVVRTTTGTGVATIGNFSISSNTIATTLGPVIVSATGLNPIFLNSPLITATGILSVGAGIESSGTTNGSVLVQGGQGITGNLYVGGLGSFNTLTAVAERLTGSTNAESTNTGDLVVQGGQGIWQDLWVGGTIYGHISTASLANVSLTATTINVVSTTTGGTFYPILASTSSGFTYPDVNNNFNYKIDNQLLTAPSLLLTSTADADILSGALVVDGGVFVAKSVLVGANINVNNTVNSVNLSVTNSATIVNLSATNISAVFESVGTIKASTATVVSLSANSATVTGNILSTNSITGALTVAGGVGIGGDLNVGGNILAYGNISAYGNILLGNNTNTDLLTIESEIDSNLIPAKDNTYTIGTQANTWAEGYVNTIYSNALSSQAGNVSINPASNLLEINADIRVNGSKPYGTAPVVTNVLYVSMDGSDTNDGRAADASRACKTIGAALNSPYYGPGTSIKVAPGHYYENNPLLLQPYTSIIGSDLRTTSIEPINKTQDLFHLQSGCYLAQMQFLNGRSGVLPGTYASGYNRGAYATAFPPHGDANGTPIDVYHSPYIQNCTNQSGPWLYDGTMFIPNQTVQVPLAVATATWASSSTTITITISTGTIIPGYSINGGQQDPGFFNARTLLLANKPFIQEQVVAYVNQTYPGFNYNQALCFRDTGIIVENLAYDATFGGNQNSIEAGLAYWNGVVSVIAGQETQTSAAVGYINLLAQQVITNTPATNLLGSTSTYYQVINTALTNGNVAGGSISNNVSTIIDIINNGPSVAPALYYSSGPDSDFLSAEVLLQANRSFIQSDTFAFIQNIFPNYFYDSTSCYRDTGLIVDAIAQDLLFGGQSQTTFAGIQYWSQTASAIPGEETTTTAAINYISSLAQKIIVNNTTGVRYQSTVSQVTNSSPASAIEVATIASDFSVITDIIQHGTVGATDRIVPNGLTASIVTNVLNAYTLLQDNIPYLQAEALGFITATSDPNFTYNAETCQRDVGYIVDSVSFDLLYGGNRQAIQSGVYYYSYNNSSSIVTNEYTEIQAAYNHIRYMIMGIIQGIPLQTTYQSAVTQVITTSTGTSLEIGIAQSLIDVITGIITAGPIGISKTPIGLTPSSNPNVINAALLLNANRAFIQAETVAYVSKEYNAFAKNANKSYRDTGLVIDAISQDIILGGNVKTLEAALSYWPNGVSIIADSLVTCTMALNHARDISLKIIQNIPVTPQAGNSSTQVINTYFSGGIIATQSIMRSFNIITSVMEQGPSIAPPVFQGAAVFAPTGISGDDVKIAPTVSAITPISGNQYSVTISQPTVSSATNASLYFGTTYVWPLQDKDVPIEWQQRRVDPLGSIGGSLVDGAVVSKRSPIQSFVYDAYTQVPQGGRGIHVINSAYAQLVSVFTIFCSTAVEVDNGGIASITNSNANFGQYCLVAKGYGAREFSGTVYNPPYPNFVNNGEYYPNGFFPNGGSALIFVPDTANRPHIAQIMEIVPPLNFINTQGLPGFLEGNFNTGTLTTGSITISGISTDNVGQVAIGQAVYVVDQNGRQVDSNGVRYCATGTVVTDVSYQTITLNKALTSGGGDPTNSNYFNVFTCGNAYYTVLSSTIYPNPVPVGDSMIPGISGQEVIALHFINSLTNKVISNITATTYSTLTQAIIPSVVGGSGATSFVTGFFNTITNIVANGVNAAPKISSTGTIPSGAGSAINLITANTEFITQETISYINALHPAVDYNRATCQRDIGLIADAIAQDLLFGGQSQSTFAGIQYWSQSTNTNAIIPGEITTTTAAINYLSSLAQKIVVNDVTGPRYQSTVSQVTNSSPASAIEVATIASDFSVITDILTNGTVGVTDKIVPNSLTSSTTVTIQHAFALLQANRSYFIAEVDAFIRSYAGPGFVYNQTTCYRDVGFMLNSVSFDLLYGGNRQAIQSGVYYYSYSSSSRAINSQEVPQTTAAYEYLSQLIPYIVQGITTSTTYQYAVPQVIPSSLGTNAEVLTLQADIGNIVNIIQNGPSVAADGTAIGLTASTNPNVINAANAIIDNIPFLKAELIAYIDSYYDLGDLQVKCARDVRLILQQLIYDLQSGGNYYGVYSGLSYWSRGGTYHLVNLEESVTDPTLFPDGATVNFYQRSYISASGYLFEYVGAGTNYGALPQVGQADPVQSQEVIMLNGGKVFFTSTDQNGDFRIGPGLVISQATGVLSGRTFTKSLFANLTPFILAIEAG